MEGKIFDVSGREYALPALLGWDVSHGFCSPCDSFEARFLYDQSMLEPLSAACRFSATHEGETVFRGVVDEFELSADERGCVCLLQGRGMQALLLDSQTEGGEYFAADTGFILDRHARALGVTDIDAGRFNANSNNGQAASLTVSSGESHWSVLSRFAEFCLGVRPRFTPAGRLLLDGADSGRSFTVTAGTAVSAQTYAQERYSVVSEVVVLNRVLGTLARVEDPRAREMGIKRVRVVNVPRKTAFDAMQHTAAYQTDQGWRNFLRCRLTVAECFPAFPGDRAVLESTPLGITGEFTVDATRCWANGRSAGTVLDLKKSI